MIREKKFASPGDAKEAPAGRLMDTVIENVVRLRGLRDFYRQKNGSIPLSKTRRFASLPALLAIDIQPKNLK